MPFNNDGLLVTSKLCTYYSAVGSTDFVLKLHVHGFHVEIFHALHGRRKVKSIGPANE